MEIQELAKELHNAQIKGEIVSYLQPDQCEAVIKFLLELLKERGLLK